jgi:predicted porin
MSCRQHAFVPLRRQSLTRNLTHAARARSLAATLAAAFACAPSLAQAADPGSECCADLDARVAELEETVARRGNRRVGVEVYGLVNQALLGWYDGKEADVYEVTNDNQRTRFGFKGKAKIDKNWEAGFKLEIGIRTANSKRVSQIDPKGNDNPDDVGFDLRDIYWYLKEKHRGTLIVGLSTAATDKITEINLTQTESFAKYSDVEDTGLGMLLRSAVNGRLTSSGISWRRLIGDSGDQPGEGERGFDVLKYESPALHGFWLTASLGTKEFWDVALRYKGEFGDVKFEAGVGYLEVIDGAELAVCAAAEVDNISPDGEIVHSNQDCQNYGGSFSVLHEKTGLFLNFGTGLKVDNLIRDTQRFSGTDVDEGQFFWAAQTGVERKFNHLGKTTIYGEYYDYDGAGGTRRTVRAGDALNPTGLGNWAEWYTDVNVMGAGIAQGIDKAAMILYLSYRHVEGELQLRQLNGVVANGPIADAPLDDLDLLLTGAVIKF